MSGPSVQPVLLCACLAAGLLFDPMGFLRMTLVCAFVHESGHVLAYMLCAHKLPGLHFSAGGIGLSGAEQLPRTQELWVLAAGPLANFIMAALLFCSFTGRRSYALYFLAAVSLCTGVYNLMPFGVLDGARLLQNLLPAEKQDALRRAQPAAVVPVLRGGARLCAVGRDAARRSCGGFPGAGLSAGKGVQAKIKKKGLRSA